MGQKSFVLFLIEKRPISASLFDAVKGVDWGADPDWLSKNDTLFPDDLQQVIKLDHSPLA